MGLLRATMRFVGDGRDGYRAAPLVKLADPHATRRNPMLTSGCYALALAPVKAWLRAAGLTHKLRSHPFPCHWCPHPQATPEGEKARNALRNARDC